LFTESIKKQKKMPFSPATKKYIEQYVSARQPDKNGPLDKYFHTLPPTSPKELTQVKK